MPEAPIHVATRGLQELQEALSRARSEHGALSDHNLELLSVVVTAAVAIALIPEEALIGTVAALGAVGLTLAIASSIAVGTVLSIDLLGGKLSETQRESVILVKDLTSNPYSLLGGTAGYMIDGDYGMRTGVTAGAFMNIIAEADDAFAALGKKDEGVFKKGLHFFSIIKEMWEVPSSSGAEHPGKEPSFMTESALPEAMIRDLLRQPVKLQKPMVSPAFSGKSSTVSSDQRASETAIGRTFFEAPTAPSPSSPPEMSPPPPVPPPAPPSPTLPPPDPPPAPTQPGSSTSPSSPEPSQALPSSPISSVGSSSSSSVGGSGGGSAGLMPEYLGGTDEGSDEGEEAPEPQPEESAESAPITLA